MVEESSTIGKNFTVVVQTNNKNLEHLLKGFVQEEEIRLESVGRSENVKQQQPEGQIITFIIGSDVNDPIQSAQRLHAYKENAKIIILSTPQNVESLKETIKFSPFIGVDVVCLDETNETELAVNIENVLQESLQAENYRDIIEQTNSRISVSSASEKPAYNQNFINKLMDVAPIGIAIVDQQEKVLGWNKEAASIFDKNEAQILGKPISRLFGHSEGLKLQSYLNDSFAHINTGSIDTLSLDRKSGEQNRQVLSLTAAPFTYLEGTANALILTIKDVTEREQAQRDLEEINKNLELRVEERTASLLSYQDQLRSLASRLSKAEEQERQRLATELHDNLGQMLAVNKMKMDLLPDEQLPEETAAELEQIKQGMDDALVYTRELMSDLKPPPTLDKEDVRATIEWLAEKMEKHDLKVTIEDDGKPKRAREEIRTTLLQSVRELLFNIIKHTEENKAFIRMTRRDNRVQILVEDKGGGIDSDMDVPETTEEGGFGLFNIKERMDLLGGSIDIESGPTGGTIAKLIAPLEEMDIQTESAGSDTSELQPASGDDDEKITVMLVDDHSMIRKGLKKVVDAEQDLTVVAEASDGKEAVEKARKTSPDIIVMDVDMPRMNGIDATREIMGIMPEVRVIGLSLHGHQKVVESMRGAGATAYLSKEEAYETLSATIRSEANAGRD